jgi:molybdopterin synthase catalytic subunit
MPARAGVHEKGTFSLADGLKTIRDRADFEKAGAIAVFVGVVRGETVRGEQVRKLTLEAYEEKANEVLMSICDDLRKKPDIVDVQIHHLLGEFNVGEDLVYVLVAGSHRASVFSALEEAVERYKKEAPIFKKEQVAAGKGARRSYWVSEGADSQS